MKMPVFRALILSILVSLCAHAQGRVTVTSATEIDSGGGAAIKWENPNWGARFEDTAGLGIWNKSRRGMVETPGVWLLDFEPANGFPKAVHAIDDGGLVLNSLGEIKPFSENEKLTRIASRRSLPSIGVQWRAYDEQSGALDADSLSGGVFMVSDRGAGDVFVSGGQGLVAAPVTVTGSPKLRGGVLFTFDEPVDLFSVVVNTAPDSGATPYYLIVLFDGAGKRIGSFRQGVKAGDAMYVGFTIPGDGAYSVWVGQASRVNGVVIDDVAVRFIGYK